jgi:hypothetical protein
MAESPNPPDSVEPVDPVYECKPFACQPSVTRLTVATLDGAQVRWLPNDKAWAWECPHGRTYILRWEGSMTFTEMEQAIGLPLKRPADNG